MGWNIFLSAVSGLVSAIITLFANNWLVNKREKDYSLKLEKELCIYKNKTEAILEAIIFLENYIASTQTGKSAFDEVDANELTISARKCMDKLIVYCEDSKIVTTFDSIILKGEKVDSALYIERFKKFRALCRFELGLSKIEIETNDFYWYLTTNKIKH